MLLFPLPPLKFLEMAIFSRNSLITLSNYATLITPIRSKIPLVTIPSTPLKLFTPVISANGTKQQIMRNNNEQKEFISPMAPKNRKTCWERKKSGRLIIKCSTNGTKTQNLPVWIMQETWPYFVFHFFVTESPLSRRPELWRKFRNEPAFQQTSPNLSWNVVV